MNSGDAARFYLSLFGESAHLSPCKFSRVRNDLTELKNNLENIDDHLTGSVALARSKTKIQVRALLQNKLHN